MAFQNRNLEAALHGVSLGSSLYLFISKETLKGMQELQCLIKLQILCLALSCFSLALPEALAEMKISE